MTDPRKRLQVVSPQFPCGAAWLANALLELDFSIAHLWGFDTAAEWQRQPDGGSRYVAEHEPWKQTLASLRPARLFNFRAGIDVRFSHEFPWQAAPADLTIMMVRDPRDALYSAYRRQQHNLGLPRSVDLEAFILMPFEGGPISQGDMLWLHLHCWLDRRLSPVVHVVRFEDCKQAPIETLTRVADWLEAPVSRAAAATASAASAVSHLQAVEAELSRQDRVARQFNRRGEAFEWKGRTEDESTRCLNAHWQPLLEQLGYEGSGNATNNPAEIDVAAFLRWRDLQSSPQFDAWKARIEDARNRAALTHRAAHL